MTASDYVSEPAVASSKPNSSLPPPISRASISRFPGLSGTTDAASGLITSAGDGCIASDLRLSSCTRRRTIGGGMGSLSSSSGSGVASPSQVLDPLNKDPDAPLPIMSGGDGLATGRAYRRFGFILMNAASSIFVVCCVCCIICKFFI